MQTQRQLLRRSSAGFLFPSLSPSLNFPHTPINYNSNNYNNNNNNHSFLICSAHKTSLWLAQQLDTTAISSATPPEVGPIEIPPSIPFDDSGALQTAASVLLSGAFTLFLFRTFRRRARRAKQMRLRSSGAKMSVAGKTKSRSSPEEAFLGAVIAAVFCLLLYKFTTAIELSLNRQTLSNNYSVRQITITIRTIINGICYLATFVFGFNSVGLFLYSGQLALDSAPPLNKPSEDQTPDKIKDDKNDE